MSDTKKKKTNKSKENTKSSKKTKSKKENKPKVVYDSEYIKYVED